MHHIHRTQAFILNSFPFGEADKQLLLLTEEYGLIRVKARGIRKKESKLRQSVQEYSLCDVALVHGKGGWILTNASFIFNILAKVRSEELRISIARVLDLVSRMAVDEEPEDHIYEIVFRFVNMAMEKGDLKYEIFEIIFLLNILSRLGYVDSKSFEDIDDLNSFDEKQQKEMIEMINRGIRESGLLK